MIIIQSAVILILDQREHRTAYQVIKLKG